MAGPRGVRAEKAALRERIRAAGMGQDRVAAELARKYQLRPRAAWRDANGWSLTEAAAQINEHAARSGLDPAGVASMTGPHLSEYETWPGPAVDGGLVAGRKPGPYLLALLARVYGCTVADLVDVADREQLPPSDLLLIEELSQRSPHRPSALEAPASPGSQVVPASRAAGRSDVMVRPRTPPGLFGDHRVGGLPFLPGVAYGGIWERQPGVSLLEYEVVMTAHESSEHAEHAEQRDIGDTTLEQIRADIARLSREYMSGMPFPLMQQMRQVRNRVHAALERRVWPRDQTELYFDLACLNFLMAGAARDLGYPQSAEELVRAGWAYAAIIDHRPLMARLRSQAAHVAYWDGRPRLARKLTAGALAYEPAGQHVAVINMHAASAAAAVGDADAVRRAIANAETAREREYSDEVLELGGEFGFSRASQHYYAGRALMDVSPGSEGVAELERATALYAAGPEPGEDHGQIIQMLARADLATARLRTGDLDAAVESLEAVFALPPAGRTDRITQRLRAGVRAELAGQRYQRSPQATELDERIEEFGRETIVAALHDLPGGAG